MIEAVTAMLVCGAEIFVIRRQNHLRAFPGYHAFPGGKIDADDQLPASGQHLVGTQSPTHLAALHRELSEELEFDLISALGSGEVIEMSLFGTAVTPAFEALRFSAHYYKITLRNKPAFKPDANEIYASAWLLPSELNQRYQQGRAMMVVPMYRAIAALAKDINVAACQPFNLDTKKGHISCLQIIDGLKILPIPSNTLPPAIATNALLLGDSSERQVLVDPSPKSEEIYAALVATLVPQKLDAILLSHHHPDHHERAFDLAREQQLPVLLSEQTRQNLQEVYGVDYIAGVTIEIIQEGDEITRWKGQPVRVYELPGHDNGMVGLAPDGLAWFFIADLAQSQGSIVIPEYGGDLAVYYASLQRVIDLKPRVILPSHGITSGGTEMLKRTLAHRLKREQQIRQLNRLGLSVSQMKNRLYPQLDKKLHGLALQNIRQHLRKIEQDPVS